MYAYGIRLGSFNLALKPYTYYTRLNQDFQLHSIIGSGGFGKVLKATSVLSFRDFYETIIRRKSEGTLCAIKIVEIDDDANVTEWAVCLHLHHPNIVSFGFSWKEEVRTDQIFFLKLIL